MAVGGAAGLLFGWGLLASGMADPRKVKAFLDVAGAWDPSLALVLAGAVGVAALAFLRARHRPLAWSGDAIELPGQRVVDVPLLLGAALFGIGWGLAGFCPGPALVALSIGGDGSLWFVTAMLIGMLLHDLAAEPS